MERMGQAAFAFLLARREKSLGQRMTAEQARSHRWPGAAFENCVTRAADRENLWQISDVFSPLVAYRLFEGASVSKSEKTQKSAETVRKSSLHGIV